MKKLIAAVAALSVMISSFAGITAANAATDPFAGQDTVNVVYLGGSITKGAGVSDASKNWVSLVGNYMTEKFSAKTVNNYNMGFSGTGSDFGLMRLERDVISKSPDYVFIEFAVNDIGKSAAASDMESIVRTLSALDKVPCITFVYTAKYNSSTQSLQNNSAPHQEIADYYGIPTIDMKKPLEEAILSTGTLADETNVRNYLTDLTHPTEAGYAIYANTIKAALDTDAYYKKPQTRTRKLDINAGPLSAKWADVETAATSTGTWTENANATYGKGWTSSSTGDTLEYTFYGPVIGIQHRLSQTGGQYSVEIDGSSGGTIDTYYAGITTQGVLGYQNRSLGNGKHTLKLTLLDTYNAGITDGSTPAIAFDYFITQKDPTANKWINENYEDCDFSDLVLANSTGVTYDWETADTYAGSKGAAKFTVSGDFRGPSYRFEALSGVTYNISAKIKVKNLDEWTLTDNSDKVIFIIQARILNDDGTWASSEAYTGVTVTNTGITSGDWVTVNGTYTCDGKGKPVGSTTRVATADVSRAEIRLGDGNIANTTGTASQEVFLVDDFSVQPQEVVSNENILADVNFDDGTIGAATVINSKINVINGGADGTGKCAEITPGSTAQQFMGIKLASLNIRPGGVYKISYDIKGEGSATDEKLTDAYLDYSGCSDPTTHGTGTNYPRIDNGATKMSTSAWRHAEYIYKTNNKFTTDYFQPSFYTRVDGLASGLADYTLYNYLIDNLKVEKVDEVPYNGSFERPFTEVVSLNKAQTSGVTPWSKGANTVVTEETTGGVSGNYLAITQNGKSSTQSVTVNEINQYIDLESGAEYELSFYAKAGTGCDAVGSGDLATYKANQLVVNLSKGVSGEYNGQVFYLTDQWAKYTKKFTPSSTVKNTELICRMLDGKNTTDNPCTYYIDEIKLTKTGGVTPKISDLAVTGNAVVGQTLSASCGYSCSSEAAGYMYTVTSGGVQKAAGTTTDGTFSYVPQNSDSGKTLTFTVRAVAANGNVSNILSYTTAAVTGSVEQALETAAYFTPDSVVTGTINGKVMVRNNSTARTIKSFIAIYDANNDLIKVVPSTTAVAAAADETVSFSTVSLASAAKAKMFVWDESTMDPYCTSAKTVY